jgi:uncharacterized RDD family membrane protein YckC
MSSVPTAQDGDQQTYRGQRLGLPETGPRSLARTGARVGAFLVDVIASGFVAAAFIAIARPHSGDDTASHLPGSWSLIPFALDYIVGLVLGGRTLGMYLFGLRVIRVDRAATISVLSAVVRTVFLALLVPAIVWDRDGRGLHDRLASTAVVTHRPRNPSAISRTCRCNSRFIASPTRTH